MDQKPGIETLIPEIIKGWNLSSTNDVWIRFNIESDTLFIMSAASKGRPGISKPVFGSIYARVALDNDEVFGLQIEDFLEKHVRKNPSLIDLLDRAETPGMTAEELVAIRRRLAPTSVEAIELLFSAVAD
ncbi:MAG: hypothetical protein ACRDHN_01470 [Thermomicrobiales bacterium]